MFFVFFHLTLQLVQITINLETFYITNIELRQASAYDLPGGDTIVMKRLKEHLERKGITVDCCGETSFQNQQSYDLVHLFNLTLPEITESFAKKAVAQNVPFVITTLQEDFRRCMISIHRALNL